jgi:hypothetical protein
MASGLNRAFLEVITSETIITEECVGGRKKREIFIPKKFKTHFT